MPTPVSQEERELGLELLRFASSVDELGACDQVLNKLHQVTFEARQLSVLGALLFPVRWGDWNALELGKTVFLHKSAPKGWWDEYLELIRKSPSPGLMMAHLAMAPFTVSEAMQMLEPLGVDRWPIELALKYGMRDRLTCPVAGRWVVVYWSRTVLSQRLTPEDRAMLFMGATFAAIRLQKLVAPQAKRVGQGVSLTPRELSVLRRVSVGDNIREVAEHLGLGEETVRSHLKKAQTKLGARNRPHAVAQAIRQHLIP